MTRPPWESACPQGPWSKTACAAAAASALAPRRRSESAAASGFRSSELHAERIEEHHRIHRLERPGLPRRDLGVDGI
jgi:hypothetical protein